ncbi:MAG TPA: hypothetical protein VEP50_09360 [bacterium]|nr:hypothetical protein [bacterium]
MRWTSVPATTCAVILFLTLSTSAQPTPSSCPVWPSTGKFAVIVFVNNSEPRAETRFLHAWGYPSIFNTAKPVCTLAPNTYCVALVDATLPHVLFYSIEYAPQPVNGDTHGEVWLQAGHLYKAVPWGDMLSDRGRYQGPQQIGGLGYPAGADPCQAPTF